MFERRLKSLLFILAGATFILVVRLVDLQIVRAAEFRRRAERALVLEPRWLPFVRGSILDRTGEVLVSEEPCWDLSVDYPVLRAAVDASAPVPLRSLRRWHRREGWASQALTDEQLTAALREDLGWMWAELERFASEAGVLSDVGPRERAELVCDRVERVRRAVARRRGFDAPVEEEQVPHTLLAGLGARQQIAAREWFSRYPWVRVEPSTERRFAPGAAPFAHVLGRMGRVDAEAVAQDPNADDPFGRYRADERRGITGVELVAEPILRGRRGRLTLDRDGHRLEEEGVDPLDGSDVRLTLHGELQRRLYDLLGQTVDQITESSGGAIVVVDVPTREVLALVSYPSFDPNRFDEFYPMLRDDTERLPLWFRAVASRYAPGSTVKPLICLAGLMNGLITLETRETCTGYLFPDVHDRWRCWRVSGTSTRKAHGSVDVVEALAGSCNVFMYRLGESLGVDRICGAFDMVGIGKPSGTGLAEEVGGINPTPGWLMQEKNIPVTPGVARNFAIGQGEVAATPVQIANLMAVYASGVYQPVTLVPWGEPPPVWMLPPKPEHWRAIREGMYRVVNDPDGTAYKHARLDHDRYALCGKTGSATVYPWPTSYLVPYLDDAGEPHEARVFAGALAPAVERFLQDHPHATFDPDQIEVASRWPIEPAIEDQYSHAWFGGFLQPLHPDGSPDWNATSRIAMSVLIEFGGSGGRTSGPLGRAVASTVIDVLGPELDPDARSTEHPVP